MSELLSPAGTIEAFHAAINNGANAIYLGLDRFNARAYANNFTIDSLKELLDYAHLRNVKIYVTVNTIIYDKELNDVYYTLDKLASLGVDGIIVQDLAVASYITNHYRSLLAHASTQMGIDDVDGALLAKELGFKRIVLARETPLKTIKEIKDKTKLEVEVFVHGALCVSYSGNCYMSSAIGERSGNRGRCAGCCRKYYSLLNLDNNEVIKQGYLLSMKDLNVSNKIKDLSFIDSFKIEGRMKEPNYVASVTNTYRKLIDNEPIIDNPLEKVFNRTYTLGYMNGETSLNITNIVRPNNFGYLIGKVVKQNKQTIWIKLNKPLSKGDQINIETNNKYEISVPILKLFDANFNEITTTNKIAICRCDKKVEVGALVYKTKDKEFIDEADKTLLKNCYKKLPISIYFAAHINKPLFLKITYQNISIYKKSRLLLEEAKTSITTKENVINQIDKLNDTPYMIDNLDIEMDDNLFIPLKLINEIRREAINELNEKRLKREVLLTSPKEIKPQKHDIHPPILTVEVSNDEQYEVAKNLGIKNIYYKNVIRRNNATYLEVTDEVLVNGLGGIYHYKNKANVISDSSLNIVNHESAAILSSLGVNRITLSQEISKDRINTLIENYYNEYHTYPNLELIVYGHNKIMHSKYCPLKRVGHCGECKKYSFGLKDDYETFPLLFNDDCTTTLLNSKRLNLIDDLSDINNINYYRLILTIESKEETEQIIKEFQKKLLGLNTDLHFDPSKDTKGHFYKNPL